MSERDEPLFGKAIGHLIHDIRNPLNVIIGFSSLMQSDEDMPDEIKDYIGKIYYSGMMIEEMLTDVDVMNSDNADLDKTEIEISSLFKEIFEVKKMIFPDNKIVFNLINTEDTRITVSAELLKKIMDNLYNFSRKGLRTVQDKIIYIQYIIESDYLRIIYSDTSDPVEISDDYFTYDDVVKARRGLGLLFVKKYIDLTDSKITYLKHIDWKTYASRIGLNIKTEHGFVLKIKI